MRAAFVAEPPVHLSLTDGRGDVLAQVASKAQGALGERGPVCVRRGDTITLNVGGSPPWAVRFVAWASP
jgi:endonuclease YncB( thermonuclease family)